MCWPLALGVISSGVSKSFAQIILDKDHLYIQKLSMHISSCLTYLDIIQSLTCQFPSAKSAWWLNVLTYKSLQRSKTFH